MPLAAGAAPFAAMISCAAAMVAGALWRPKNWVVQFETT